jgi:hypothetical protein
MALAVDVQVAEIRRDQARERNAVALRHSAMLEDALFGFEGRHGHPRDPKSRADHQLFLGDLETTGAGRLTRPELQAARDADVECHELDGAVVRALGALTDAWKPGYPGELLVDWIGCSARELEAAVQAAVPDIALFPLEILGGDARN